MKNCIRFFPTIYQNFQKIIEVNIAKVNQIRALELINEQKLLKNQGTTPYQMAKLRANGHQLAANKYSPRKPQRMA